MATRQPHFYPMVSKFNTKQGKAILKVYTKFQSNISITFPLNGRNSFFNMATWRPCFFPTESKFNIKQGKAILKVYTKFRSNISITFPLNGQNSFCRTDRQTDRQTDRRVKNDMSNPYRGGGGFDIKSKCLYV